MSPERFRTELGEDQSKVRQEHIGEEAACSLFPQKATAAGRPPPKCSCPSLALLLSLGSNRRAKTTLTIPRRHNIPSSIRFVTRSHFLLKHAHHTPDPKMRWLSHSQTRRANDFTLCCNFPLRSDVVGGFRGIEFGFVSGLGISDSRLGFHPDPELAPFHPDPGTQKTRSWSRLGFHPDPELALYGAENVNCVRAFGFGFVSGLGISDFGFQGQSPALSSEVVRMETLVKIKVHAPSGTIIFQRPAKRNALSRLMMLQIKQALEDLHQERKVRAVVLTGAGDAFCAGIDLKEIHATYSAEDAQQQWHRDAVQYKDLLEVMLRYPKPIIAAVNGPAAAAGEGLVLASDIVVAAPQATFGLPEPRRGLVAGPIAPLLVFRVGGGPARASAPDRANGRCTGRQGVGDLPPDRQQRPGLGHGSRDCRPMHESSPEAIQLTKRMLNETIGEHLSLQLNTGAAVTATARTTEAAEEGVAAFLRNAHRTGPE